MNQQKSDYIKYMEESKDHYWTMLRSMRDGVFRTSLICAVFVILHMSTLVLGVNASPPLSVTLFTVSGMFGVFSLLYLALSIWGKSIVKRLETHIERVEGYIERADDVFDFDE